MSMILGFFSKATKILKMVASAATNSEKKEVRIVSFESSSSDSKNGGRRVDEGHCRTENNSSELEYEIDLPTPNLVYGGSFVEQDYVRELPLPNLPY
ncbi:hypothetical protein DPMN_121067 [Dreissena polymorpha]|uniref:Uncharacterized protein n=1 Tax=Dreissena polymorpha TaxID=45954 RepID=A0A9D4JQR9_DREPO|nr:hypothetical protein DPMN_121067 [Dreissena polymorpha]